MRVKIVKISPDRTAGANYTYPPSTRFARFPICNYISQSLINADFFTFGPDILMIVLEDYIIFLIWAAWVLFSF